ncbi:hypothetical protein ALNOE001_02930 [Candidatus Methanobinarius endosymbioticus]|uniref:Uncharacterized protein n=1 Tax=Candidatus Methanobinarius endosymbioticus TaxID=2006182 RepID=A0A366MDV3_9EURY|nr:hypothetical protein ALNOE001_02930 [Candidatus Methanobinarius endosymbioticus]
MLQRGSMIVSRNIMNGNTAALGGNMIFNNGQMGVLNLTYINNSTIASKVVTI